MAHIIGTAGDDRGVDALHGTADDDLIEGFQGRDELFGGDGSDELDGGEDADKMYGGKGNDIYHVDNAGDLVVELAGEGSDTVFAARAYTLTNNVEKLVLTGSGNYQGNGNALNNSLIGNDGNNRLNGGDGNDTIGGGLGDDTLDGGSGLDTLNGGDGNDRYFLDKAADVVVEYSHHGSDTVYINGTYTLGLNVENLTMTGSGDRFGTGNALDNVITGNAGDNTLGGAGGNDVIDGGKGMDAMRGGMGNDTFYVDNAGDTVAEYSGQGTDSVFSTVSFTLDNNVENLTLTGTGGIDATGNGLDNTLTGNAGANVLDGRVGADIMAGGAGSDIYVVDNAGDVVTEASSSGRDTVRASINYTLVANVENLTLTGVADLNGTGNGQANTLTGNAGNNDLNGGVGADTLAGGLGNDVYHVDTTGDIVQEDLAGGMDTVMSSVSYTLSDNVEDLVLFGANLNGTGNALGNSLTGTAGANILDGGAGADTLNGGAGNDTYIVDNIADVIADTAGTDTVKSSVTYSLDAGGQLENIYLTGTGDINAVGNDLSNIMGGNSGNNIIDGAGGTNTIDYTASADGVTVDLLAGTASGSAIGSDTLINFQRVWGSAFDDTLSAIETMAGGKGNDSYIVSVASANVVENATSGTDTVMASITYFLTANVENLTLTGTANIDGTGNGLNNVITGNSGNNTLWGQGGNDTMMGGAGDDTYVVEQAGDVVVENAGEGTDTVETKVSFSLAGTNVENLVMNISASGTHLTYTLTGSDGDNNIMGGNGQDTIIGGAGNDTLSGGADIDTFVFGPGSGNDVVTDFLENYIHGGSYYDKIDVHAYTNGAIDTSVMSQSGSDVVFDFGDGNVITLTNTTIAGVSNQIVW